MKILFTGASSFTGCWFVRELAAAGHDVTTTFRRRPEDYEDPCRGRRVRLAASVSDAVYGVSFGDEAFLALAARGGWDLLAHHAADVTNYRSADFDVVGAVRANTRSLAALLERLRADGCVRVALTGSVFEAGEGAGSDGVPDLSPYGLSKSITARVFQYYCRRDAVHLGKFVIPNPFGPLEERRYTRYLVEEWFAGRTATCATPAYVRDNIHVSLLAKAYVRFVQNLPSAPGFIKTNPTGYVETQGAFTLRFAQEMRGRLGLACEVAFKPQTTFPEPRVRINTDPVDGTALGWDEARCWDELADHYRELYGGH